MVAFAHQPVKEWVSLAEYLAIEERTGLKYEWFNGQMWLWGGAPTEAMAGATPIHNTLSTNVIVSLGNQLRGKPCQPWGSDQKIKVAATGLRAFPDVVVACPPHQWDEETPNTLLNPRVLIEVLSPSTADFDHNDKFDHYRQLASMTDYVMIASDRRKIEHYHRREDGDWLLHIAEADGDLVQFSAIDCRLLLEEVYERIAFPTSAEVTTEVSNAG